jgi:hypothetical protein
MYSRANRGSSGILPGTVETRTDSSDRGKGKKHRILTYVREYPEELRPVCLRLLRQPPVSKHSSAARPRRRVPRKLSPFLEN